MDPLHTLGFALGTAFASGINLYATVATVGLLHRLNLVPIPAQLEVLSHPVVLGIAIAMFVIEFVADKIPLVDNVWDAIHTFIRPPAAALVGYSAFTDVSEPWRLAAALVAGSVAFTAHGAKASTRAAANTSPEPVSNWTLSFVEDALAISLTWMAAEHPVLTAAIVVVLVLVAVLVIWKLFGFFRKVLGRIRGRPEPPTPAKL